MISLRSKLAFFLIIFILFSQPAPAQKAVSLSTELDGLLGNRRGCIILLEAQSGRILAAAHPGTAFRQAFPPGSLFKVVTALALLKDGKIDPKEEVFCRDSFRVGSRTLTCRYPGGHGKMNLTSALARSCCIYFYTQGLKLPPESLLNEARLLGLGQSPGQLLPPRNPNQMADMLVGEGPGILVTPMQMAEAIRKIATAQGGPGKKTVDILKRGMRECVRRGTGKKAALGVPVSLAGKTGTAQDLRFPGRTLGWFGGFAPYPEPKVIVLVFVEGGNGADSAAPLAGKALQVYFLGPDRRH